MWLGQCEGDAGSGGKETGACTILVLALERDERT